MAAIANFPLSVSGCALDTSPPKGVEEMHELAGDRRPSSPPSGGEVSSPKGETERGTSDSRCSPNAIALPLWGGSDRRSGVGVAQEGAPSFYPRPTPLRGSTLPTRPASWPS
jgi:hypothetical protein